MEQPDAGDKTITLYTALVAAKLNLWMQNPSACVKSFVIAGELQMATYPVGSGVAVNEEWWQDCGEQIYLILDDYNNGQLCALSRDVCE